MFLDVKISEILCDALAAGPPPLGGGLGGGLPLAALGLTLPWPFCGAGLGWAAGAPAAGCPAADAEPPCHLDPDHCPQLLP